MPEGLSTKDVATQLGVTQRRVQAWANAGAPCTKQGRRFVFDSVSLAQWLVTQGEASTDNVEITEVLQTRAEVAERFGVTRRMVTEWLADPSFPGKAGSQRKHGRDGNFPVIDIARWLLKNEKKATIPDDLLLEVAVDTPSDDGRSAKSMYLAARAGIAELQLEEARGRLVDADEYARWLNGRMRSIVGILKNVPANLAVRLEGNASRDVIAIARKFSADETRRAIAECNAILAGDDDDEGTA